MSASKQALGPRKQFNTVSPHTPKRHPTFTHHSNCKPNLENPSTGVTYAELQIILENVHQVKKKAQDQIAGLHRANAQLEAELAALRDEVELLRGAQLKYNADRQQWEEGVLKGKVEERVQAQLQGLIREKVESITQEYSANLAKLQKELTLCKDKLLDEQQQNQELRQQVESLSQELQKNRERSQDVASNLTKEQRQAQSYRAKYDKIVSCLHINENSHQLTIIKQQYNGIPQMLTKMYELRSDAQRSQQIAEQIRNMNDEYKAQVAQNNKVIEALTDENRHLLTMVDNLNRIKEELQNELAEKEMEKSRAIQEKDHTLNEIEDEISNMRKTTHDNLREKQQVIGTLNVRVQELETKLIELEERQRVQRQEAEFKSMVDQVCNEYGDYENVLRRTQYLEKYRSEYYFNTEKIQYLCKLLDSL